jgi:hypothetical protein
MKEHLSDLEIAKIQTFCADEIMYEAVKKVILQSIYIQGVNIPDKKSDPLKNGAFSMVSLSTNNPIPDEVIGQQLRAQWAGVNALENGMRELKNIKNDVESPYTETNEAI